MTWRWIYHSDFYDGPMSGMVLFNGRELWAECIGEDENDQRIYRLLELDPEMRAQKKEINEDFCKWVGTHCNFDENGNKGEVLPMENWDKFYEKWLDTLVNTNIFDHGKPVGLIYEYDNK